MTIASGTRFGRYEVRSPLGAGGMGEVYLAHDTELERTVALKILPADVAADQQRMQRFVQEAKAASALNHPNILTIHEIGVADSGRFIATEFIDGVTLRKRMAGARLPLRESLDISIQIASALAAAHAAGITHRDIKPENVMVRTDGYVKVLDFGLAKLTERDRQPPELEAPTRAMVNTDPGVVMGTAAYMSPEQAGGLKLDARTDIWSLGVVIYEMVTGRLPFEGATTSHMIVSILEKEPTPLRAHLRDAPEALEWIITKALAKDKEERYQVVKDLLLDLKKLKQRLEVEAEIERSVPPERLSGAAMAVAVGDQASVSTATVAQATPTGEVSGAHPTTSAEYLVGKIGRHKRWVFAAVALIILVPVVTAIIFLPRLLNRNKPPAPFQNMKITRLTTTGKASDATISPDGRYVVHVMKDGGQQSLWVRQVNTASNVQIVPPAEVNYRGLTFSRDGDYIYYVRQEPNHPVGVLYQVAVLGGPSRKLLEDIDTPVDFSPDNKSLTFGRYYPSERESALMVANADGTGEKKLVVRKRPDFFSNTLTGPVWSPDGKVIACVAGSSEQAGNNHQLVVVDVESGAIKPIGSGRWYDNKRLAWLADGSGLVMPAASQVSEYLYQQIWYVSYPEGEARKITNDLNNYTGLGLTADSKSLVTVQFARISNIWTAPGGDASHAKQITSGGSKSDGIDGVVWTPDGKIVYRSTASGNEDLWIMEADGSGQKQLTANQSANYSPTVSADGRYVVFVSDRTGREQIWRMNIDGSDPRQLTTEGGASPSCSPDGRWIAYDANATLWRIGIDGGQPLQLTTSLTASAAISPDGKQLACFYRDGPLSAFQLAILPAEGGQPLKVFDVSKNIVRWPGLLWTTDGRSVIYIDSSGGVSNLWSQPVDGGAPKQLTDFKADSIFSYDYSRDGRQLVLSRGTETNDVILIRDSK